MIIENLEPTLEEVKQVIAELTETPMNKSMLVLKRMNHYQMSELAGISQNVKASDKDAAERKVLRPFYVLAVSEDMETKTIQPLDKVRVSRITEPQGLPIACSLSGFQVVVIREYDVFTVIKHS